MTEVFLAERVAELRRLCEAATPGPWGWRGHDDGCVELRTLHSGGLRVVSAMRGGSCIVTLDDNSAALTIEACDECRLKWKEAACASDPTPIWEGYRCPKDKNLGTVWLWHEKGFVKPANYWAIREKYYRSDVAEIAHPDAEFIAAARDALPVLLDTVEAQTAVIAEARRLVHTALALDASGEAQHELLGQVYGDLINLLTEGEEASDAD